MKVKRIFVVAFLTFLAASLLIAEEPLPKEPPKECSEECLNALDPYFRTALWYYENYFVQLEGNEERKQIIMKMEKELRREKVKTYFLASGLAITVTALLVTVVTGR